MPKIDYPVDFIDPISLEPITPEDDVVTIDGDTEAQFYKRETITNYWNTSGKIVIPNTNALAKSSVLITNELAKKKIKKFIAKNKICTQQEFFDAVKKGQIENINYFDTHLTACDKDGNTALHIAASQGYEALVKLFINELIDLEAKNKNGLTPLHLAVKEGHLNVVKLFLSKNKHLLQTKTKFGSTVLHLAAKIGNADLVKLFLAENLKPNDVDQESRTSLYYAAEAGHLESVKLLMTAKFDIDSLLIATANNHIEVVKLLLTMEINWVEFYANSPLSLAIADEYEELIKLFLEKNPNLLNIPVDNGMNVPLDVAAKFRRAKIVKLLLEKYKEFQNHLPNDIKPLELAIKGVESLSTPYEETIKLFIEKLPNLLQAKTLTDQTCLHLAVTKSNGILKLLLAANVDVDAQDYRSNTPLHLAAKEGKSEAVKLLLEKGANLEITNNDGLTPIQIAKDEKTMAIMKAYQINYKKEISKKINDLEAKLKHQAEEIEVLKKQMQQILSSKSEDNSSKKSNATLVSLIPTTSPIFKITNKLSNEDTNHDNIILSNI